MLMYAVSEDISMSHMHKLNPKEEFDQFIGAFATVAQTALYVSGYVIVGVILLAVIMPSLPIVESIVDGTALKIVAYAALGLIIVCAASGFARFMTNREKPL